MATNEPLLSIQDVAKRLSLQYRSVYRLVVSGQIPAARIGGVYRVRPSDLEKYIENQMSPKLQETPSCSRCRAIFTSASQVAGQCSTPSCDLPLCTLCWASDEDRLCREHAEGGTPFTRQEAEILAKAGQLEVFVSSERARQMELTLISRFTQAVQKGRHFPHPMNESWVRLKEWNTVIRTEQSLSPNRLSEQLVVRYGTRKKTEPVGDSSLYYFLSGPSGQAPFAVGVVCVAHMGQYRRHGFDTARATHSELLYVLSNALDLVRHRKVGLVLGLASPTGWDSGAEETVAGSPHIQSFSHAQLGICLIDLLHNSLVYNPTDRKVARMAEYFKGDLQDERTLRVCEDVAQALLEQRSLSRDEVARTTGESPDLVEIAFTQLEAEGTYIIDKIPGLGSVISRRA